jgi:hypothetical protein
MENFRRTLQVNQSPLLEFLKITSVLSSLVNVAVFSQKRMRQKPLLQYLYAMSVVDAVYFACMATVSLFARVCLWTINNVNIDREIDVDLKVCYFCSFSILWLSEYFGSALALSNIILEIKVNSQRISLMSPSSSNCAQCHRFRPRLVWTCVLIVSHFCYTPVLFMYEIKTVETRNVTTGLVIRGYFYSPTEFGLSSGALLIPKLLTLVRMGLVVIVLTVVNVIAIVKFTVFFKRKSAIKYSIIGNCYVII